jgi:hypothetical protein
MKTEVINILKNWYSSLERNGKLDVRNLSQNLSVIGGYVRAKEDSRNNRDLVRQIRDKAICPTTDIRSLQNQIIKALETLEPRKEIKIKGSYQNSTWTIMKEGQEFRFRGQTAKIFEEKLKFKNGMLLRNFDVETESASDSRKVRKIIEKRMCQAYHKMRRKNKNAPHSNRDRYCEKRATAYQLYNIGQIECVSDVSRGSSTHWKRMYDSQTGTVVLKKKMAYSNEEAALSAIKKWKVSHPNDKGVMHAYKCSHCGKWHIGHDRYSLMPSVKLNQAC